MEEPRLSIPLDYWVLSFLHFIYIEKYIPKGENFDEIT